MNMKPKLVAVSALGLTLLSLLAGCCTTPPPSVAVREAIHRSELASTNRLALPLSPEARAFARQFLRTGRNPALEQDATVADASADARYEGLLARLSAGPLTVADLVMEPRFEATPAFKPWFPKPALRQVIDAREYFTALPQPYAFLDASGKHWWVFYPRQRKLTHVLITRATPTQMER